MPNGGVSKRSSRRGWKPSKTDRIPNTRIRWLVLDAQTDLEGLAKRSEVPDVLLGGIPRAHLWLADQRRVHPEKHDRGSIERVGSRSPFERTTTSFADPRTVPASLEFALNQLGFGRWSLGYAELVRMAGGQGGAPAGGGSSGPAGVPECASVLRASNTETGASWFLRFISETRGAGMWTPSGGGGPTFNPLVESLIADLLGAALVDARDELEAAWSARRGRAILHRLSDG